MSLSLIVLALAGALTLANITYFAGVVESRRGRFAALLTVVLMTPVLFGTFSAVIWVAAMGVIILRGSFAP